MREPEMFDPLIGFLKKEGYDILSENRGKQRGPDIIASKNGKKLIIELKGDSQALSVDFGTGIYQLLRYIDPNTDNEYALGVSMKYARYAREVQYPCYL